MIDKSSLKFIDSPESGIDVLWRITVRTYSEVVDAECELYSTSDPQLEVQYYPVLKRTPKGAWIDNNEWNGVHGNKKFVLLTAYKKWACNSLDDAIESFIARKKRQINILAYQLEKAKYALGLILKE